MRSQYSTKVYPGYFYILVTGEYDINDFKAYPAIFLQECMKENRDKLLIDGSGINEIDVSVLDRFILGEEVAHTFRFKLKVAIVWPKEYLHKVMEMTAQNRGARFGIFQDIGEAKEWLLKDIPENS